MNFDFGEHTLRYFFRTDAAQPKKTELYDASDPDSFYAYICIASMYNINEQAVITPTNGDLHLDINKYLIVTGEEVLNDDSTPINARSFKYPKLSMIFSFKGDFFKKMASFFKGVQHQKHSLINSDKYFAMPQFSPSALDLMNTNLPRVVDLSKFLGAPYRDYAKYYLQVRRLVHGTYNDVEVVTF